MCMPILRPVCRNFPARPTKIDINDFLFTHPGNFAGAGSGQKRDFQR